MTDAEPAPLAPRHRSLPALHGAVAVLAGLLGGPGFLFNILRFIDEFPFVPRIQKQVPGTEAAWRSAHTGPIMNGMLAMGVSASGSMIELSPRAQRRLVAAVIVTVWGNVAGYNAVAGSTSQMGEWSGEGLRHGGRADLRHDQRGKRRPRRAHALVRQPRRRARCRGSAAGDGLTTSSAR